MADPHGDVVATSDATATATPAVGIAGWVDQDEYGNPLPAGSASSLTKGVGYGWVGAKQRATLDTGLLLMGARVYNPSAGQFTSTDPVYGGNDTTYAYPTDPINSFDLNGKWGFHCGWCHKVASVVGVVSNVIGSVPFCAYCSAASAALGYASAGLYAASGDWRAARRQVLTTTVGLAMGGGRIWRSAGSRARHVHVGWARSSYRSTKHFLREGGLSGVVVRGARRQGYSRAYQWGTAWGWHGLGVAFSWHG